MSRICTVCSRLDRAAIDVELSNPSTNVAAMSRRLDIGRAALDRHKREHLPTMLRIYGRMADLPKLGELHAEYLRLYAAGLDHLAEAQAGTLLRIDDDGTEHRVVSHSAVARAIAESRKVLDSIVSLAADAAETDERPRGLPDAELSARIALALERTMARSQSAAISDEGGPTTVVIRGGGEPAAITEAEVVEEGESPALESRGGLNDTPGPLVVGAPAHHHHQIPLDAVEANQTPPGLTENAQRVVEADRKTTELPRDENTVILTLPNPRYPGSPAATREERAAAGYDDIEITLGDLRTNKDRVAEIIAEHRQG